MLALAACGGGGGGGDDGGGTLNLPPVAAITANPTSGQSPLSVAFDGTGSRDSDGSIVSYSWNFGDNTAAGSGATVSHTYSGTGSYTATLTVTDNQGATGATTRVITVASGPPPASVTVGGVVTFDRVPHRAPPGKGLDYAATFEAPARGVVVEAVGPGQAVLASTVTDAQGHYSVTVPSSTNVFIRARARLRPPPAGPVAASWDVRVLDNTSGNAAYVLDGAPFDSGVANQTRNLRAGSGWTGSGYGARRAAAPFAILDSLYAAVQLVIGADGSLQLSPLEVFWSPQNRPSDSWRPEAGLIETTLYRPESLNGAPPGIYVLGAEDNDTDEYDAHIVAHEYQHYLEDEVSRTDTIGGDHSIGERLDMRLAFSEGFANAFAAMALGTTLYRDAYGTRQGDDFSFDVEDNRYTYTGWRAGWYDEGSVQSIVWDLYDSANDGVDTVALGFAPMLDVMRRELRTEVPLTSLFPFVVALKQRAGVPVDGVNAIVDNQEITALTMNRYATTEDNSGGIADVIPIYTEVALNGAAVAVCGNTEAGTINKIGNVRFLRFNVPTRREIEIVAHSNAGGTPQPDPDFYLYSGSFVDASDSETPFTERYRRILDAGDYVLEVYEYSHIDPSANAVRRPRTCMAVTITG